MKMSELGMGELVVKLGFEITEEGELKVEVNGIPNAVLAGLTTLVQRVAEEIGLDPSALLDCMKEAYVKSELEKDNPAMQEAVEQGLKIMHEARKNK